MRKIHDIILFPLPLLHESTLRDQTFDKVKYSMSYNITFSLLSFLTEIRHVIR